MKKYTVQKGDSLDSIAEKFWVKNGQLLRSYHNMYCPLDDLLGYELVPGKELLIPEESEYLRKNDKINEPVNGYNETKKGFEEKQEEQSKEKQEKEEPENNSSEHDGKYFVIQKGMCQCNQGFKFPKFKVTSHQKHYWNDNDGNSDYLAVTEDDTQLDPLAQPFGQCRLKPSSGGYLPCTYTPLGKWTKTYEKVKVIGKSCVTEISELMCTTGGKITVFKHGQQSEAGKSQVKEVDVWEQRVYSPIVNFEKFQEEMNEHNGEVW